MKGSTWGQNEYSCNNHRDKDSGWPNQLHGETKITGNGIPVDK